MTEIYEKPEKKQVDWQKRLCQHITKEWLETSYFVGDVFDELADEVDMCRRHLKKLAKDIQITGIP